MCSCISYSGYSHTYSFIYPHILQVSVDPVISTSSRISEGSTLSSRHSKGAGNHDYSINARDDLMIKLKSLEQEHQRLLSSHSLTEVALHCIFCAIHTLCFWHTNYVNILLGYLNCLTKLESLWGVFPLIT